MRWNRAGPNSNSVNFGIQIQIFLKKIKNVKKLNEILKSLVKKFLQICDILLVKIQNESNMTKWTHLAHNAHGGYFLPPVSAEQKSHEWALPPLEQAMEAGLQLKKLPVVAPNSAEWADNSVVGDSGCGPTRGKRISAKNHRLIGKMRWFFIFSYDFSVVVSLNVDYMVHCGGY
jgi:hypothetical protein